MSQAFIDDAIWARLEPLIPARRRRRGHRHGRTPIPDRAILIGILFVLHPAFPGRCCLARWAAGPAASA
jgi:transposase